MGNGKSKFEFRRVEDIRLKLAPPLGQGMVTDVTNEHSFPSFPQGDHRRGSYDDDEEFEGPMKNRGCRDIICLLIFLAYVGFMAYLFFYSVVVGDVNRLTKGYDISGNSCGEKSNDKIDGVPFSGMDTSEKP